MIRTLNVAVLLGLIAVSNFLFSDCALAQISTFRFEAVYERAPSFAFPVPTGTRAIGTFSFDRTTPPTVSSNFTSYEEPITDFQVELETFGVGTYDPTGISSNIRIGTIQTSGSENYTSDQFTVRAPASGLTIFTESDFLGDRELIWANIRLQDIDLEAIESEALPLVPPSLSFFQDNIVPDRLRTDAATLFLNFRYTDGGTSGVNFRLTSLTVAPEEPVLKGDLNLDGEVDFFDITPFIAILFSGGTQVEADCSCDGIVNFLDVAPLINILAR